jgi:hypothetical protein
VDVTGAGTFRSLLRALQLLPTAGASAAEASDAAGLDGHLGAVPPAAWEPVAPQLFAMLAGAHCEAVCKLVSGAGCRRTYTACKQMLLCSKLSRVSSTNIWLLSGLACTS